MCAFSSFADDIRRPQPEGKEDERWNDQQIIQMTYERHKVGNQIDWRQRIGYG